MDALGTCVVHIALLASLPADTLPGQKSSTPAKSDIASFDDVYYEASEIFYKCVRKNGGVEAGWTVAGESL